MNRTFLRGLCSAQCSVSRSPRFTSTFPSTIRSTRPAALLFRYASTSEVTSNSKKANVVIIPKPHPVNGPLTTLPAPINLPARQPSQSRVKHLIAAAKAYKAFYKTGIKNVYANYKLSRILQARLDTDHSSSLSSAIEAHALTRSEFQLLARNRYDLKCLPIFALVLLICGEFTPLVVIVHTSIVPWTCRIPKQIHLDRVALERRRRLAFRNSNALSLQGTSEGKRVDELNEMQLVHITWSLGLSSGVGVWTRAQFPGLPTGWLKKKVKSRVEYLEMDDKLIQLAGGVGDMDVEEVRMALVERGMDVLGREEKDMKAELSAWLKSREKATIESLLLTRPSSWPVKVSDIKNIHESFTAAEPHNSSTDDGYNSISHEKVTINAQNTTKT